MFKYQWFIGVFALALLLAGCAGQAAPSNTTNATSGAPAAAAPTPSSDKVGTVTGKLLNSNKQSTAKPMAEAPLYLGTILKSQAGAEGLVQLVRENAPKTTVDAQGNFVFTNVPPGRYGLMLDTPRGAILLNKPVTGENMVADVSGGQVFDFGELTYNIDVQFQ